MRFWTSPWILDGVGLSRVRDAASTTSASMTRPASRVCGLGPGYLKSSILTRIFSFQLLGFFKEKFDETGTMVLPDGVDNILAEFVLSGNFDPFFDMGNQDQAGHGWCQFVMFVFAVCLIFNEIQWFIYFTDIMVVPADFGKQMIGANFRCCRFHQGPDDDRMMIGARRLDHESSKNRAVQICQFKKGNIRRIAECDFNQGNDAGGHDAGADSAHEAEDPVIEKFGAGQIGLIKINGCNQQNIEQPKLGTGRYKNFAFPAVLDPVCRHGAAYQENKENKAGCCQIPPRMRRP